MSFESLGSSGLYVISDTFACDGTGALFGLLKTIKKKCSFISDPGNYSHYNYLFKKHSLHYSYYELSLNIELGDLPLTEDYPATWLDAPKRIQIESIFNELNKSPQTVIVIDDISSILLNLGAKRCVGLVNSLKSICELLIIKANAFIIRELWVIEENCDVLIEITPLESGYTTEYSGRVRIIQKTFHIKTELGTFWYKLSNDTFELIE